VNEFEPNWKRSISDAFFVKLHAMIREQAIQRDLAGWWLREWAVAEWVKTTVFAQAIDRQLAAIFARVRQSK